MAQVVNSRGDHVARTSLCWQARIHQIADERTAQSQGLQSSVPKAARDPPAREVGDEDTPTCQLQRCQDLTAQCELSSMLEGATSAEPILFINSHPIGVACGVPQLRYTNDQRL